MKRITFVIAATSLVALSACQANTGAQQQANCVVGTAGGAALGAIIGSQVGQGTGRDIATVAGAAGGGLAGSSVLCQ
jgi:outer membrane lipoprotein SlyB